MQRLEEKTKLSEAEEEILAKAKRGNKVSYTFNCNDKLCVNLNIIWCHTISFYFISHFYPSLWHWLDVVKTQKWKWQFCICSIVIVKLINLSSNSRMRRQMQTAETLKQKVNFYCAYVVCSVTRLCFQYLAVYSNENLPKSKQIVPNFAQNQINCHRFFKYLPKWWNFAKSGHTASKPVSPTPTTKHYDKIVVVIVNLFWRKSRFAKKYKI